MGPRCTALLLMIHSMASVSGYASSESPIIVPDPVVQSNQKYQQQLEPQNANQQPVDNDISRSAASWPGRVAEKSDDIKENNGEYFIEYEPMKLQGADITDGSDDKNQRYKVRNKKSGLNLVGILNNSSARNKKGAQRVDGSDQSDGSRRRLSFDGRMRAKNFEKMKNSSKIAEPGDSIKSVYPQRDPTNLVLRRQALRNNLIKSRERKIGNTSVNHVTDVDNVDERSLNTTSRRNSIRGSNGNSGRLLNLTDPLKELRNNRGELIGEPLGDLDERISDDDEADEYEEQEDGVEIDVDQTQVHEFVDDKKPTRQSYAAEYKLQKPHEVLVKAKAVGSNRHYKLTRKNDGDGRVLDDDVGEISETRKEEYHEPKEHSAKHEAGGHEEHHEGHEEIEDDEGEKDYEIHHEHEDKEKGHKDKERHDKSYDEEKGHAKKLSDDSEYHEHYESGEKNEKEGEYEEEGKFSEGHSTKGDHVVHKKDEYEKLVEFYDESHENDGDEKDGEYNHKFDEEHGGSEKSTHGEKYGKIEKHEKGSEYENGHNYEEEKGHDSKNGHEKHYDEGKEYGKEGGHAEGKKWMYKA